MSNGQLTREDFEDHLGSAFTLTGNQGEIAAFLLVRADPAGQKTHHPDFRPPFSLTFKEASQMVREQDTYTLTHPVMGEQALFLVPIGKDETGVSYESCFS